MPQRDGYAHGTPGWVDLSTADTEGSKAFYGELFGWSWEDQEGLAGASCIRSPGWMAVLWPGLDLRPRKWSRRAYGLHGTLT